MKKKLLNFGIFWGICLILIAASPPSERIGRRQIRKSVDIAKKIPKPNDEHMQQGPKVIPTIEIISVETDQHIEISTDNFPAADNFTLTMGPMGSKGIGGIIVGSVYSGSGGRFTIEADIPPSLYGHDRIAIRLESLTSGYYAYSWFQNIPVEIVQTLENSTKLLFVINYPTNFKVDEAETLNLTLFRDLNDFDSTELGENHISVYATPQPVGTPSVPLMESYGEVYYPCVTVKFSHGNTLHTDKDDEEEICYPMDKKMLRWDRIINADRPGKEPMIIRVDITWQQLEGYLYSDERHPKPDMVLNKEIAFQVKDALNIRYGDIFIGGLITAFIIAIISSGPFLYKLWKDRKQAKDEKQKEVPKYRVLTLEDEKDMDIDE